MDLFLLLLFGWGLVGLGVIVGAALVFLVLRRAMGRGLG